MKILCTAFLLAALPLMLSAQLSSVRLTAGASGTLTSAATCPDCDWGTASARSVGVVLKKRIGLGVRSVHWRGLQPNQSMSFGLVTADLLADDIGRVTPFLALGAGRGSVAIDKSHGGHQRDAYSGSGLRAHQFGMGVDIRLYRRLSITPSFSLLGLNGPISHTHCYTWYNAYGYSTTECESGDSASGQRVSGFGIGIGWR
jgi:hypothetical protein